MIANLNQLGLENGLDADICVVGTGAAGISVAREFIGTNHSVILLEAGSESFSQRDQEPYQSELAGLSHEGVHTGRARVVGGTTTLWAGQALPLFDIDFKKRDWIPDSGWPIERSALSDFYPRAESVMQIPHVSYDSRTWPGKKSIPPHDEAGTIDACFSQFTAQPDFFKKYRAELIAASNVKLITHANVISLQANPAATAVECLALKSFEGKQTRVRAKVFIICCGGIETPRLLLASDSVESNGIGNQHDVVGRYFQDHPGVTLPLRVLDRKKLSRWYNSFRRHNIRHSIKLAASEKLQQTEKILNVGAEVFYPADEQDPIHAAKVILKSVSDKRLRTQVPASVALIARKPHRVLKAALWHYLLKQPASVSGGCPHVGFSVEQMPNRDSRVKLGQQTDSLGMRRTVLDWRVTCAEGRSIAVFANAVANQWRQLHVADFNPLDLNIDGRESGHNGGYIDASHHMGTTRMGNDPRTSVVNSDCLVHNYQNLYIGSSAVFPTGGFSNPTLTLLALCMRMCDHIKRTIE